MVLDKEEKMENLVKFVNEPFDELRSYGFFCRGVDVTFHRPSNGYENGIVGVDGKPVDLEAAYVWLSDDGSMAHVLEEARSIIKETLFTNYIAKGLTLSVVSTQILMMEHGPEIKLSLEGYPFTPGDLVFTFFESIKEGDIGRCRKDGCEKIFLGTRNGTKGFCSNSCRVASHQKRARQQNKSRRKK